MAPARIRTIFLALWAVCVTATSASAADWPVYQGDEQHRGLSSVALPAGLKPLWTHKFAVPPKPGFFEEMKIGDSPLMIAEIDLAFAPVVADGRVYVGSSSEDLLRCLDLASGKTLWDFHTEGAVRLAPTVHAGKVYAGSDDGTAFCLDAATGAVVWQRFVGEDRTRAIINGRVASSWPVRGGVLLHGGRVYFGCGLFPEAGGVQLVCLDAADGKPVWRRRVIVPPMGYLMADDTWLYVTAGRAAPTVYRLSDGSPLTVLPEPYTEGRRQCGGPFIQQLGSWVAYGPNAYGIIRIRTDDKAPADPKKQGGAAWMMTPGSYTGIAARRIIIDEKDAFILRHDGAVQAVPRAEFESLVRESAANFDARGKQQFFFKSGVQVRDEPFLAKALAKAARWTAEVAEGRSMIATRDAVVVGGLCEVHILARIDGKPQAKLPTKGTVWELAVADKFLLASTDIGSISAFGTEPIAKAEAAPSPKPLADDPQWTALAKSMLAAAGRKHGYCFVLGGGEGRLARALANESEMSVVCVERDRAAAKALRERLARDGAPPGRVVVQVNESDRLDYRNYLANLVTSEAIIAGGQSPWSQEEAWRLVEPYNGAMAIEKASPAGNWGGNDWQSVAGCLVRRRGALPGAGSWTHLYADAANTLNSNESRIGRSFALQWFGGPGPETQGDRHGDPDGPLAHRGRLFYPGLDNVIALDAYNGAELWRKQFPGLQRLGVGFEGGALCVDDAALYLATTGEAVAVSPENGEVVRRFPSPLPNRDWGLIAIVDGTLLGSAQHPSATWRHTDRVAQKNDKSTWGTSWEGFRRKVVVSDALFAYDSANGKLLWRYDGKVLNPSFCVGGGRVYVAECRGDLDTNELRGRVAIEDAMKAKPYWVALDLKTGRRLWEKPITQPARWILYLTYSNETLVATTTYTGEFKGKERGEEVELISYGLFGLSAADGSQRWRQSTPGAAYTATSAHNFDVQRPVIADGKAYLTGPWMTKLSIVALADGKMEEVPGVRGGKYCGLTTGSQTGLYYRKGATLMYHLPSRQQLPLSTINRPACWVNILPACGLILMPDSTAGCNCAFPIQASFAFCPMD